MDIYSAKCGVDNSMPFVGEFLVLIDRCFLLFDSIVCKPVSFICFYLPLTGWVIIQVIDIWMSQWCLTDNAFHEDIAFWVNIPLKNEVIPAFH